MGKNVSQGRPEIRKFVAELQHHKREEIYVRAQLTPFEECALFGYQNCPVSHRDLVRKSSKRAGLLCEYFSRISTMALEGERYEVEVEYELDEMDVRGDPVTATKLEAGTIEWPVVRAKTVDLHAENTISLDRWFNTKPVTSSSYGHIGWSQINRAREVAAMFAEGKVIHGTLPEYNNEHVLVQTEPLILSEPAFEQAQKEVPFDLADEKLVEALTLNERFIERYNQRGTSSENVDVSYLDFLDRS